MCLSDLDGPEEVQAIGDRLHAALRTSFEVDGHSIQMQVSIGGAVALSTYDSTDEALHVADMAMYEAKDDDSAPKVVIWERTHGRNKAASLPTESS